MSTPKGVVMIVAMSDVRLSEALPLLEEGYRNLKQHREFSIMGAQLVDVYMQLGKVGEAAEIVQELMDETNPLSSKESPQFCLLVSKMCGDYYLPLKQFEDAELLLRDCVEVEEKSSRLKWRVSRMRSLLGEAMAGQSRFADAEPLALAGIDGLLKHQNDIPPISLPCVNKAFQSVINLYTSWNMQEPGNGYDAEAIHWKRRLDQFDTKQINQ